MSVTPETPTFAAHAVRDYVEGLLSEDDALSAATVRALEFGCSPIEPGAGAAVRFLAAALRARAVVEVGTGTGVSGLWLLRGMAPDGVLTSIDVEPEYQRAARRAFAQAGVPAVRTRLIMGHGIDVLPRLTDGGYDLVLVHTAKAEYPRYLEPGIRLLRRGGVIVFPGALHDGRVADPAQRDPDTVTLRELARAVHEDERLVPVLLPAGEGILAAAKTG